MSIEKITNMKCDQCGKIASRVDEPTLYGVCSTGPFHNWDPFHAWIHINYLAPRSSIYWDKREWDVCSEDCAYKLMHDMKEKKVQAQAEHTEQQKQHEADQKKLLEGFSKFNQNTLPDVIGEDSK